MNEQLFNGMRGITRRLAYRDVFMALGFSYKDECDLSNGDFPGFVLTTWNHLIGEVK